MARGYAKQIILGNVVEDPKVSYSSNDTAYSSIRVAVNSAYRNRDGELVETAEFYNVKLWGKTAEFAAQYVRKGDLVFVDGEPKTERYEDKEGNDRYFTFTKAFILNKLNYTEYEDDDDYEDDEEYDEYEDDEEEEEYDEEEDEEEDEEDGPPWDDDEDFEDEEEDDDDFEDDDEDYEDDEDEDFDDEEFEDDED